MKRIKNIIALTIAAGCIWHAKAELNVGIGSMDITPPVGTELSGYTSRRVSNGILDPLEAIAVAFSDGTNRAVVISADIINLRAYFDLYREGIAADTGLDPQAVFIACTHTHTGPVVCKCVYGQKFNSFENASVYARSLKDRLASAAKLALSDLAPARLSIARGEAKGISFVRRYRMKDGSCRTNPGVGNPNIVAPIGVADEQVQLVRIDREGKDAIAIVNFQCHPDTIGGCKISADWPRVVRETVERVLDGVKCVLFNGPQGDTNHICTDASKKALQKRSSNKSVHKHMGRVIAGEAIGLWDICEPVAAGKVGFGITMASVKTNRGTPEQVEKARKIMDLVRAGRSNEVPGKGMQHTTNMAEARRIEHLANGPDYYEFPLSAVTIGNALAFTGFPGEPFTGYGLKIKEKSPFTMTIPVCVVNGNFGYLPTADAFKETGYETQGSFFTEGLEKAMLEGHLDQLDRLIERK